MKSIIMNFKLVVMSLLFLGMFACDEAKNVGSEVEGYLKIKDALVASNAEEAKEYAVATMEVVDAVAMPEVQQAIKEIAATSDLEVQRKAFENFSIHLYRELKASDKNEQTLFKQYCPMAFENQGAFWLSAQKEIRNPYFGDRMLKCGRVEEELPVNN